MIEQVMKARKKIFFLLITLYLIFPLNIFAQGVEMFSENGKCGFRYNGKVIAPAEYDSLGMTYGDNYVVAYKNGKVGLFGDKLLIPVKYDSVEAGYRILKAYDKNRKITYFYSDGGTLLGNSTKYDYLSPVYKTGEWIYLVGKRNRYGIINKRGRVIIPLIHGAYQGEAMTNKMIFTTNTNNGCKWYIYSPSGKLIASRFFDNSYKQQRMLRGWLLKYGK